MILIVSGVAVCNSAAVRRQCDAATSMVHENEEGSERLRVDALAIYLRVEWTERAVVVW
jgi:hypothetical protein